MNIREDPKLIALRDALSMLANAPDADELCDRIVGLLERPAKPWVWMPHPAHFIDSDRCAYHLATWVSDFIVSTVGDWQRNRGTDIEEIAPGAKYETMVFRAAPNSVPCGCPVVIVSSELECYRCNNQCEAYENHMRLCKEWSQKQWASIASAYGEENE